MPNDNEPRRKRANVLGVGIDAIDLPTAVGRVMRALDGPPAQGAYVCVTGVHGVMEAQRDPRLRSVLNRALVNAPDGMPTVWVGRAQGHHGMERVYGPDLMLGICRETDRSGHTHFLYGGKPGVTDALAEKLTNRFPGLRIVGAYTPPFRPLDEGEERRLTARIEALKPDLFWVGLSTPKQERFMAQYAGRLATKVMLGVGAAFDFHAGRVRQAPHWMQRNGLEWLFRLSQEPRRLYRRYLVNNPAFMYRILLQGLGLRRYWLDDTNETDDGAR